MFARSLALALCLCVTTEEATAQDAPSRDTLAAILRVVYPRPEPTATLFERRGPPLSNACPLQPAQMNLTRNGRTVRSVRVLVDNVGPAAPKVLFATLTRMTVDSDGAGRTYHPEDPLGAGVCRQVAAADGKPGLSGICALDQFSSGGTFLFSGSQKLSGGAFATSWSAMWPKIRDRSLKSVLLADVYGPEVPRDFYLFYWRERNLTAVFRDNVIPKDRAGYPCRHNASSDFRNGYFISSTTLATNAAPREDGCYPDRYLDSETVPFVVVPKGSFGGIQMGDLAIVRLGDRTAYAVVGDEGPPTKFGEGSIALNAKLLGKYGSPFLTMKETWGLDIDGAAVSMLILGNTRGRLNGDYSPQNIEVIARRELARWGGGGDPLARFEACRAAAAESN